MDQERFSIGELATAAATTPRTIRFYTAEGLLPPPLTEGRNAIYTETHRRRLRLIQRLKAAYLPLSAIKEQLTGLTDEQVDALLERGRPHRLDNAASPAHSIAAPVPEPPAESANVAYVAQILAAAHQALSNMPDAAQDSRKVLLISPLLRPDDDSGTVGEGEAEERLHDADRWARIPLRSGIELHVREPLSETYRAQLDRLIGFARSLFPDSSR
jgi:DNA-binding transcriptional MerR regulator